MMRALSRRRGPILVASVITCLSVACGPSRDAEPSTAISTVGEGGPILVASFDFSESVTLAHIYAGAMVEAGYDAQVLEYVGSKEIVEPALQQGLLDFVPEYQGTALEFVTLGAEFDPLSPEQTNRQLRLMMQPRGVEVLQPAPGENKNEVVVTRETAEEYDLGEISDLRAVDDRLTLGGPPECPSRPLCLIGLEETYGLRFGEFRPLDVGGPVTVTALENGEIDVGILFTTSPSIPANDFIVLEDDLGLQPHENIVPVVRDDVIDRFGSRFIETVDSVSSRLTDAELRGLNQLVEQEGASPIEAAKAWLKAQDLAAMTGRDD
jgi:osmoprotectant transport system substrate-binding protein